MLAPKTKFKLMMWAALFIIAMVVVVQYAPTLVAPGDLTRGHQKQDADCMSCHTPFLGVRDAKCIDCHPVDKIGVREKITEAFQPGKAAFHTQLTDYTCSACHTDHQGRQPEKATTRFVHAELKESLRADCAGCHKSPTDQVHRNLQATCSGCHGTEHWKPATLDHDEYFRFDSKHQTECDTCHLEGRYPQYTCYGCHAHTPRKIAGEHREEGIREFEQCSVCHKSGNEDEAERIWKKMKRSGQPVPLTGNVIPYHAGDPRLESVLKRDTRSKRKGHDDDDD